MNSGGLLCKFFANSGVDNAPHLEAAFADYGAPEPLFRQTSLCSAATWAWRNLGASTLPPPSSSVDCLDTSELADRTTQRGIGGQYPNRFQQLSRAAIEDQ